MKIFKSYTGNALLNNALMTVESLLGLSSVSEITSDVLWKCFNEPINGYSLLDLNSRLKSYTMLFTKNGPLHNDKEYGVEIYQKLMKNIIEANENSGQFCCDITGLRYDTSFDMLYVRTLKDVGVPESKIKKKDQSINRCWFPLIGGLGSDAQALSQAKFAVQIHPICIAIMQFLPLSALLYKGGVLLVDSSNFEFSREYVERNVKEVVSRVNTTEASNSIENIKDYSKGNYLLSALDILEEKEFYDDYADLNLWSFSNSGTGASCEIDRIPNSFIKKMQCFRAQVSIRREFESIISNPKVAASFIEAVESRCSWYGLYPSGKGSGVSVDFFKFYYEEVLNGDKLDLAQYISFLIEKYKSKTFTKLLKKSDAYKQSAIQYHKELISILVEASKQGEWNLELHLNFIDSPDVLPVKGNAYEMYRIIHFFYQVDRGTGIIPQLTIGNSNVGLVSRWLIALIQSSINEEKTVARLTNSQDNTSVSYNSLLLNSEYGLKLGLSSVFKYFYNIDGVSQRYGINELLRIFFSQIDQESYEEFELMIGNQELNDRESAWLNQIELFASDYINYYLDKKKNRENEELPLAELKRAIETISLENDRFWRWFDSVSISVNEYNKKARNKHHWDESILYNPDGEYRGSFVRFAIKYSLKCQFNNI